MIAIGWILGVVLLTCFYWAGYWIGQGDGESAGYQKGWDDATEFAARKEPA